MRVGASGCADRAGNSEGSSQRARRGVVGWVWAVAAFSILATVLSLLPGRASIAPLVESDYCYLLTAADMLVDGFGPVAPVPVAPSQPWSWQADWVFLTKWPVGYPLLVAGTRSVFGITSIAACRLISTMACAAALVGWFLWIKRLVPTGVTGVLVAAVGAGCAVSTASLINPSTDLLVGALLPYALLLALAAVALFGKCQEGGTKRNAIALMAITGLLAGGLFWIRYASLFVPVGVGSWLLAERRLKKALPLSAIAIFSVCAFLPIASLITINSVFGASTSIQEQMNLGHQTGLSFSFDHIWTAWWRFTDLGFYDYHWYVHWIFAIWPVVLIAGVLMTKRGRRSISSRFSSPGFLLSCLIVGALLTMLVGATGVFGDKYTYVGLDRYYEPFRPFYFALFVAPLVLVLRPVLRLGLCVGLVVACSWLIQQEWSRPYQRWSAARREVTPYGQWKASFLGDDGRLFRWLAEQRSPDVIVVSNFQDYITLETKIPALPVPSDRDVLTDWVSRIATARSVDSPCIYFVLDPNNHNRSYYLKPREDIIRQFSLVPAPDAVSDGIDVVYQISDALARSSPIELPCWAFALSQEWFPDLSVVTCFREDCAVLLAVGISVAESARFPRNRASGH